LISSAVKSRPAITLGGAAVNTVALAACIAGAAGLSLALGQDANWDLQNYHYYNPWAFVHGQRGYTRDVVAAQLQTYHNPLPDLPFYQMVKERWDPRTIAMVMAIPAGIAAFFLWKLLAVLFAGLPRGERWVAIGAAFAIGITSGIGFGVLGTTMNEWPGAALTVAALYVIAKGLADADGTHLSRGSLVVAGLLCGFATGAKFTFGVFAVGLCAAILLRGPWRREAMRAAFGQAFVFGLAVLAGTLVTAGAWMWSLWTHFRNPVFPYANMWIKSPWWGEYEVLRRLFGPQTLLEWLTFPFALAAPPPFYVTEMTYVDGRIPTVYALALAVAAGTLLGLRGPRTGALLDVAPPWRMLGIFCVVSFVVWTAQYSLFRYLVPLELVSGALVVALLGRLVQAAARIPVCIAAAAALIGTTTIPDWWRVDFGPQWFRVAMPPLDKDPLVLATDAPMSYVLPSFPNDARFLGINNSISDARRVTLMEESIKRAIREHRGPMYSLSFPTGTGVDALLERGIFKVTETCIPIFTNMRTSPIELCRVVRAPDPPAR
jgi:hypothetical protein